MSQATVVVANGTGQNVLDGTNAALMALATGFSGASAPTNTYAFMTWNDTSSTPYTIKKRNAANTGWVTIGYISAGGAFQAVDAATLQGYTATQLRDGSAIIGSVPLANYASAAGDAGTLNGDTASATAAANKIVKSGSNGKIALGYLPAGSTWETDTTGSGSFTVTSSPMTLNTLSLTLTVGEVWIIQSHLTGTKGGTSGAVILTFQLGAGTNGDADFAGMGNSTTERGYYAATGSVDMTQMSIMKVVTSGTIVIEAVGSSNGSSSTGCAAWLYAARIA